MPDSRLVIYEKLTPKYSKTSVKKIGITPHHAAGIWNNARQGVDYFYNLEATRLTSANYVIANNGEIGQCVREENRAWTSSNSTNDASHVTIEVSNCEVGGNWKISDAAYEALVNLSVDICRRNGIGVVGFDPNNNKGIITVHRQFASTSCPGPYLYNLIATGKYSQDVNEKLKETITGSNYTYEGIDYTAVFNPVYYSSRYPDLGAAGLVTEKQLFGHFIIFGMNEARKASDKFDPVIYRKNNPDLDAAFDSDWQAYYKHYLICGKTEIESGLRSGKPV